MTVEPEYRRIRGEDGDYEEVAGYRACGTSTVVRDGVEGLGHFSHHQRFALRQDAERLAQRVEAACRVIQSEHWDEVGFDGRTWQDIEQEWNDLAHRERAGLPL